MLAVLLTAFVVSFACAICREDLLISPLSQLNLSFSSQIYIDRTLFIIFTMPKDEQGKNRKYKHHQERTFTPLTKEQMERAEKIARGEKVE